MAIGGLTASTMRALVIMVIGSWLFDVSYEVVSFWQLFLIFVLAMIALYGMGMMAASIFLLLSREAWHLANLAQEPVYLVSGFYFPIKNLGFWIAVGASFIPLTLGMDAMRQLAFPSGSELGFLSVRTEIIILIVLSVCFIVGAKFLLAHMERLAVREGRLTESRR
jgi:ABC-2 type transport system permease protein